MKNFILFVLTFRKLNILYVCGKRQTNKQILYIFLPTHAYILKAYIQIFYTFKLKHISIYLDLIIEFHQKRTIQIIILYCVSACDSCRMVTFRIGALTIILRVRCISSVDKLFEAAHLANVIMLMNGMEADFREDCVMCA